MTWLAVSVRADGEGRAAALGVLFAAGSRAVEEVPGGLRTYLPPGTDADAVVRALGAASPSAQVETSEVVVADWASAWRQQSAVRPAGRLAIAPPWLAQDLDPAHTVVVDPGMAFGTGDHPTTRGVIRLMADVVREGDCVADLGTGSGVLAIAAAKLGAARVAAIELDPDAIGNAEANVEANGVADRVAVLAGDATLLLPLVGPVRVVLANIVSPVLLALLPTIGEALSPDGRAIVGGIVEDERGVFLRALGRGGWRVEADDREDNWWSAVIGRR